MDFLVIGGNRFMGRSLVWRLLFGGHRVTLLNRGQSGDPFGGRVERLVADRGSEAFDRVVAGKRFDGVIDFAAFTGAEMKRAVRALTGRVGHYAMISTGQVYLVREGCPTPSVEGDYEGAVMAAPPTPADHEDWAYGIGKREAEEVLVAAGRRMPSTRLRIPMVNGEGDPKRRIESYLWRLLDGGPLLVPAAGAVARHVYRGAVVEAVARLVESEPVAGEVYNLAQAELPTVRQLIELVAARVGARSELIEAPAERLEAAGLSVRAASPFSSRWMSLIDPGKAVARLGFAHPPLEQYVDSIVASLLAAWPAEPPEGYRQREGELALARSL